ncbi:MAG TPA: bestrophin family ion channel [Acidisoma sp.]|jgi:putative membrane protein|nr:bestrophin family ion channel [Acidisoma sp.]
MIVRPHPNPLSLLFIIRGSIIGAIALEFLVIFCVACLVVAVHALHPGLLQDVSLVPFSLLGLALSIFLGFRNNACYQRWWEARRQWGRLLAEVRSFVRDFRALLPEDEERAGRQGRRLIAFAHSLRAQLRGEGRQTAAAWLNEDEWAALAAVGGKSGQVLNFQAGELADYLRRNEISDITYRMLSDQLGTMGDIQAACERLHSTPMPFAYTLLLHRTAWLFCLMAPVGLVPVLGFGAPFVTVILAYAFFGLDALGQELQEPFERTANAVPLDALVRNIEIAILEALGEREVPEPLRPENYVLL